MGQMSRSQLVLSPQLINSVMYVSPHMQDVTPLHPFQQLVLVPGHLQSVSQFLLSQTQPGQQGKNPGVFHIVQVLLLLTV